LVGRLNVDVPRALRERNSRFNVILQTGDSITIPEFQPCVQVTGAVNSPGSVLWMRGADLNYYLSAAGGLSFKGDGGRVSARFANGEVSTSARPSRSSSWRDGDRRRPARGRRCWAVSRPVQLTGAQTAPLKWAYSVISAS